MEMENSLQKKLNDMPHKELVAYALKITAERDNYLEQLRIRNSRKFKTNSEKTHGFEQMTLGDVFNEIEDTVDHASDEELTETITVTRKKKKKEISESKAADFSHLREVVIHHDREDKTCPDCGTSLKKLAPTVQYFLKFKPAEYYIEKHIYENYVCPVCSKDDDMKHFDADEDKQERLIEKSVATSSVIANIAVNKFDLDLPLYRQARDLKRMKVPLTKQTMSNWLMKCTDLYLGMVFDHMWLDLKQLLEVIHMDETTLKVIQDIHDSGRYQDYVWLAMSGRFESKQMALYFFSTDRKYENVTKIIGQDSQAIIHSDGYDAYHQGIGKMTVGCMAHVRRRFEDARKGSGCDREFNKLKTKSEQVEFLKAHPSYANILIVLKKINDLFKIENQLNKQKADPETILKTRKEKSEPLFNELFACIHKLSLEYAPKSAMGKALSYAINEEQYCRNYLKDGRTEISNNKAEQKIKPFVMARKNFLFSNTRSGAKSSAIYMSLIESAKMNNLDPRKYLEYVLDTLSTKGLHDEIIENVLPYSNQLPEALYTNKPKQD